MNKIRTNSYILGKSDTVNVKSVICEVKMKQITRFKFELPSEGKIFIQNEIKYLLEENNAFGDISEKNYYGALENLTQFGESQIIENRDISSTFNAQTNGDESHNMDNNLNSELSPGCGVQDSQLENACFGTHSEIGKRVFTECSSAEIQEETKGNTEGRQEIEQSKYKGCFSKESSFDIDLEISNKVQITRTFNSEFKINQNEKRNSDEINSDMGPTSFSESEYVPSETSSLLQNEESDCESTSSTIKEKSDILKKQKNDCFVKKNRASKLNLSSLHEKIEEDRNKENNVEKYGIAISDLDNRKGDLKESFGVQDHQLENSCSFNSSLSKSSIDYDLNISHESKVQKRINVQSNILLGRFQKDEQIINEVQYDKADLLYEYRGNECISFDECERADCFSKKDFMFSTTKRKSSEGANSSSLKTITRKTTKNESLRNKKTGSTSRKSGILPIKNIHSEINIEIDETFTLDGRRLYDKRSCCFICHAICLKMARHLELKHADETAVAKLLVMEKKSSQRRNGFIKLIRAGNFYYNMEVLAARRGQLMLCRRPDPTQKCKYTDFGPCPHCLGFMAKSHLARHAKSCFSRTGQLTESQSKNIRTESASIVTSILFNGSEDFRRDILNTFRDDALSGICRTDDIIIGRGILLYEKHGSSQNELIRQTMRQLARLLTCLRNRNSEYSHKNLAFFLDPTKFDEVIDSVKELCNAHSKSHQKTEYGIPSLALKIGHSLRKCVAYLRGQALRVTHSELDKRLQSFLELLDLEWDVRISSNALSTLTARKINSASLLPLTSDLIKLNKHIETDIKVFKVLLMNNPNEPTAWNRLAEATLARMILFNKRRGGEMSRMTLTQYSMNPNWEKESTEEMLRSLTPTERNLASNMKLVQIIGKKGRIVPVLMTEDMVSAVNLLISTRHSVGINFSNNYVFAKINQHSDSYKRGPDVLRNIVAQAGLEFPENVTSTKLRKYTATVCQVFNLQERELDWIARHLGHDIRVHRDFYRLHESAVELTKVSRLLMAIDSGEVSKFKGRSLDQIQLKGNKNVT